MTDRGSGYITDIGMCGGEDSIIGVTYETAVPRYTQNIRMKGIPSKSDVCLRGAVFEIDESTLCCKSVKRIKYNEGNLK